MKKFGILRHVLVALLISAALYALAYRWIEHRRTRLGPWEVRFAVESETPSIFINQSRLQIHDVRLYFPGQDIVTNFSHTLAFAQPRPWPFEVPFGKVLFMDTTFLPGTIAFELFGNEIQLLPRVLTINGHEIPWQSRTNIPVTLTAR